VKKVIDSPEHQKMLQQLAPTPDSAACTKLWIDTETRVTPIL